MMVCSVAVRDAGCADIITLRISIVSLRSASSEAFC